MYGYHKARHFSRWRLKVERQRRARRRPRQIRGIRLPLPCEPLFGLPNLEADKLKGGRIILQCVDPFGLQIRVLRLPDKSADAVFHAVEFQNRLGLDAANHCGPGHQVIKAHGGPIGRDPPRAAYESVDHGDFFRPAAIHAGLAPRRLNEPVALNGSSHFAGQCRQTVELRRRLRGQQ